MSELLEVAGKRTAQVVIDGLTYTLGNITLSDMVLFEQIVGPWEEFTGKPAGVRCLWWMCLRHGGHEMTAEEAGNLIGSDGLEDLKPVLAKLISRNAGDVEGEVLPAATETPQEPSSESAESTDGPLSE